MSAEHLHVVTSDTITDSRRRLGRALVWGSGGVLALVAALQTLQSLGSSDFGFQNWRPTLYAYCLWATCLCVAQVMVRGEAGKRTLFVLPAALFVVSLTVFPLLFGLIIAFSDWNLSSPMAASSTAWRTSCRCGTTRSTGTRFSTWSGIPLPSLWNMPSPSALRCCLSAQIRARKFFRVAFLCP